MAPRIIDLRNADDERDVVHRTVQALAEGRLVAFPTETVYGVAASALCGNAIERLLAAKGRGQEHTLTLAIKSADDALDYVPDMSPLGARLARRCWPGPITLIYDCTHPDSVISQLPESVRQAVTSGGTVGLRVPAHELILAVLRLSPGPLALSSANLSGQPAAVTAEEVAAGLGPKLSLILDDGRSKFAQPSSVVKIVGNRFEILRAGVFTENTLKRLSGMMILFVCTGNTCRSPMAEGLMKRRVAKRLGCTIEELEDRGVLVQSAGIAAMGGSGAAPEAIEAIDSAFHVDIKQHESQPLTERLVAYADHIITLTRGHRQAIVAQWPEAADRTHLLRDDGRDVSDPIGGPLEVYESCVRQIDSQLESWVNRLDFANLPRLDEEQGAE